MRNRDIPNFISLVRMILVVPVVLSLLQERFIPALLLFALAGVSDGIDGFLAKRYNWTSRLGSILDPLADKLLLVSSYLALAWVALLPPWLVMLVITRDLIILAGALAYHFLIGPLEMAPTLVSKINTTAQIVLVLAVLINGIWAAFGSVLDWLVLFVCATTLISGVDYIWSWGMRAYRTIHRH